MDGQTDTVTPIYPSKGLFADN